ncbi:MAG: HAD family hydrolase, partial [Gibbsiella quercinecans]|uniref:HAD family hydrolase n=1 Tax=Gibbsiella quercinecans TaxID=929813 RepID=UPI003F314B5B
QHGKPNPEPFLLGAGRLNLQAADCIAFEDSLAGLISAQKAGCTVVEVLTTKTVSHDITPFLTVEDYLGVSVAAARGYYFALKC